MGPAPQDSSPPPEAAYLGLNVGLVSGSVDVTCAGGADCSEGGLFPSYGINFTVAGNMALRLRAIRAEEETDHKPYETAVLIGPRLGRRWYGLVGIGHIVHTDDDYPGTVNGMAWEFVRATPPTHGSAGFEFSVNGNAFGDATFVGTSIGARFGKLF